MFWSGSPTAVTGKPPPNTSAMSRAWATFVSWYSSSSTAEKRSRYWAHTSGLRSTTSRASVIWSPKSIAPRSRFRASNTFAASASSIRCSAAW